MDYETEITKIYTKLGDGRRDLNKFLADTKDDVGEKDPGYMDLKDAAEKLGEVLDTMSVVLDSMNDEGLDHFNRYVAGDR